MTDAEKIERLELAVGELQRELRAYWGFAPRGDADMIDGACDHQWRTRRMGGDPTSADSNELVTVCEKCGLEQLPEPSEE